MNAAPSAESYLNYIRNYDNANGDSRSLAGFLMGRSHQVLETTLPRDVDVKTIVEVGSGTGKHFQYVKPTFQRYVLSDQSPEMLAIAKQKLGDAKNLEFDMQDASKLTYADESFDRLIGTHVLEHLLNPVAVLTEWNRVVRRGGVISIILPCDPGLLWRLGRNLGPRRKALAAGVKYDYLQVTEHVNYITGLVTLIRHHFDNVKELWHPFRIAWSDANLFYICHIRK